ncbi:MAG: PAS domain S-box protein [Chloroflexota bacterium]|nr:PAS domain S-box protein [Chloroflexota bacterium]
MSTTITQQKGAIVLVVDDDAGVRQLTRYKLESQGYVVEEAEGGVQALSTYERLQPDIILLDILMPGMDGFTTCAKLRDLPGGDRTPVLMVTALDDAETVDQAFEAGATDYITKTAGMDVLRRRVHSLLRARQAEEALRDSEERYRTLFNAGNDAVLVYRMTGEGLSLGRLVEVNDVACEILGYVREELLALSLPEIIAPEKLDDMQALTERLGGREHFLIETICLAKDGRKIPIEINASAFNLNGQPTVLAIARDITERKQMEKEIRDYTENLEHMVAERTRALEQEKAYTQSVIASVPDMLFTLDHRRKFSYANDTFARFVGVEAREIMGQSMRQIIEETGILTPKVATVVTERVKRRLQTGEPSTNVELEMTNGKGETIHCSYSASGIRNADGQVVGEVALIRDISEQKRLEQQIRDYNRNLEAMVEERTRELAESEQKYTAIVEGGNDGVVIVKDLEFVFANQRVADMTGYTIDEIMDMEIEKIVDLRYLQTAMERYHRRMAGEDAPASYEIALVAKDGRAISVEISNARIEYKGGPADVVVIRDITERKRMEKALLGSQKLADLGALATGVAHEINSPLQVITGVSKSLLTRLEQGEWNLDSLSRRLDMINRNAWRCAEIVRALRTYAHVSPGQHEPNDLNALVQDTLLLIEHQLKSWSNVTVVTDLALDMPALHCDRNQITQVLINLLTNARDAMPDGGEITIRTRHDPTSRQFTLQVADTGDGISESVRPKIFDPLFTTKPAGQGTGMGLPIVLSIVRAHGGEIEVHSAPGWGATFTLFFPEKGTQVVNASSPPGAEDHSDDVLHLASHPDKQKTGLLLACGIR